MAYTSESAADRLAAVRAAIDRCLSSQEYGINGRSQRMAELSQLHAMEKTLVAEINAGSGGGLSVGMFTRP